MLFGETINHNAFDPVQYAIPGQTCNNAVLNKMLFLDLSQQTLSPGVMIDYDAKAAFDRVINGLAITACRQIGLVPNKAGIFMYTLLSDMSFHLVTGFGHSSNTFSNSDDSANIGQGVLQCSSSSAPICILTWTFPYLCTEDILQEHLFIASYLVPT